MLRKRNLSSNKIQCCYIIISIELKEKQRASLIAQLVKNLPAMQETWVQSLGQEDPLEKGMATHSGILAWRISWTVEPEGSDMTE